jgi:hypothetical protein
MPIRSCTSYYRVPVAYGGSWKENVRFEAGFLMDLILFRHLPHYLKKSIYNNQNWRIRDICLENKKVKLGYFHYKEFFRDYIKFLDIEISHPAYHFLHLLPPHPPFVTEKNCEYAGKVLAPTRDNYKFEAKCILYLVVQFFGKLKSLGIYDSSFIILQADTGQGWPPVNMRNLASSDKEMTDVTPSKVGRSLALLAIKRPNKKGSMKISNAQTIITDIPSTVMKTVGLGNTFKGNSVFEIDPSKDRERWYENQFKVKGSVYDYKSWQRIPKESQHLERKPNTYKWDTTITFGFLGNAESYQTEGWSFPEDGFTWTEGRSSSLSIPITMPGSNVILKANLRALVWPGKLDKQTVSILINDRQAGEWAITRRSFQEQEIKIPKAYFSGHSSVKITLKIENPTSPAQLGLSNDQRYLGVAVRDINLIKE